jgi:hypothetical protein
LYPVQTPKGILGPGRCRERHIAASATTVFVMSAEIQPRGYYTLFILNDKGVPSKGRFIFLP